MKRHTHLSNVFIVVKVHSGIPEMAEAFIKESDAQKRAKALSRGINIDYDEVDVFHSPIKGQIRFTRIWN
jgi:hypothetical protein